VFSPMEQHTLKNVNNCLNTSIYPYLETYVCQSSILYSNVVHFSTPVLIRHLWQLKITVSLHRCLICTVILGWDEKCNGDKHSSLFLHLVSNKEKSFLILMTNSNVISHFSSSLTVNQNKLECWSLTIL
jgi:hypothetical protein